MNTTLKSRLLAGGTVAGLVLIGAASGVFGSFSLTPIAGQNCAAGYDAGYGYGYNCTPSTSTPTSTSTPSGPGGGGGGGTYVTTTNPTPEVPTTTPTTEPTVVLFSNFTANCGSELENLTDPRLGSYYNTIGVVNQSNKDRRLTRAEFLKLVINAAGIDVSSEANPSYSDVPASHTLKKYITYATRNGIVHGQDGAFRPNDLISRAEASKVFVRGTAIGLSTNINTFSDVASSASLAGYIQTAYDNCILHGRKTIDGNSTVGVRVFEPNDGITLAETAKVLYNINVR